MPPVPRDVIKPLLEIACVPDTPAARAALDDALNAAKSTKYALRTDRIRKKVYERVAAAAREMRAALTDLGRYGLSIRGGAVLDDDGFLVVAGEDFRDLLTGVEANARRFAKNRKSGRPPANRNRHVVRTAARFLTEYAPEISPSYNPTSNFARFTELFFEGATGGKPTGTLARYIREVVRLGTKPPKYARFRSRIR